MPTWTVFPRFKKCGGGNITNIHPPQPMHQVFYDHIRPISFFCFSVIYSEEIHFRQPLQSTSGCVVPISRQWEESISLPHLVDLRPPLETLWARWVFNYPPFTGLICLTVLAPATAALVFSFLRSFPFPYPRQLPSWPLQ